LLKKGGLLVEQGKEKVICQDKHRTFATYRLKCCRRWDHKSTHHTVFI